MNVYIAVDMEGATGICCREQTAKGNAYYAEGRRLLTGDVNAAVAGALEGGAEEIFVADVHDGSLNLLTEEVHPSAKVISGVPHRGVRFPYLDESIGVMFLVAYHARAGTLAATLEHTMSSQSWHGVTVNGQPMGEVGIDAALAGSVGVPVVMVSGDDKVCAEAQALLGPIETAVVKQGLGRHRAICLPPGESRPIIREAAAQALALRGKITPLSFGSPVEVAITYKHTEHADAAVFGGAVEQDRVDGYTVRAKFRAFADWYGGVWEERGI
jgi:D-amino peptidase